MNRTVPDDPFSDEPQMGWWYALLNSFPFVFLPLVAVLGVLCSLVMPYLTGVYKLP